MYIAQKLLSKMLFLYQNQVFFRKILLYFPFEIEFIRTIVQNHEKICRENEILRAKIRELEI